MYSDHQRKKVAEYARFHGIRPAARKFGVNRRYIGRWLNERIEEVKTGAKPKRKNMKSQRRKLSYNSKLDEDILQWLMEKREKEIAVSRLVLQAHAKSIISKEVPTFKASDCWLQRFMKRHKLVLRARSSLAQRLPGDLEERMITFYSKLKEIREKHDILIRLICNMDETPVYFDVVPGKTLHNKGCKTIKVRTTGAEKRHATDVLGCTAVSHLLPPMIIFKGKRLLKVLQVPSGFIVCLREKAWMDESLMFHWINEIWLKHSKSEQSLVVLDSFKGHTTEFVFHTFERANCLVSVIPGGCTSVLQPVDVSLNKPFKDVLRKEWVQYIIEQSEADPTPSGKLQVPSKQHIINWVEKAWDHLRV